MKLLFASAALALAAVPAVAQGQATGVSNPPPAVIDASPDEAPAPVQRVKPSPDVAYAPGSPAAQTTLPPASQTSQSTYGQYVPYRPAGSVATIQSPRDPDATIVTSVPSGNSSLQPAYRSSGADDDAGIVTHISSRENEVPAGTEIATRIRETISTASTAVGTAFTAEVISPMEREGRVIIPAGSTMQGRVTVVRGGRRISGAAAIHLQPESVTLPDGTHYMLHAQVVDTTEHNVTRVNSEGTILRRDHVKGTLAAMSLTTGGAAATGAVFGGVPGFFIGAGIGAGVSTAWWLKQDRQEVVPENTGIIFSLSVPMQITPLTTGTN